MLPTSEWVSRPIARIDCCASPRARAAVEVDAKEVRIMGWARFPYYIASHCKEQDFYFGEDLLLRRHDYDVDVAGGFPGAQYIYDIKEFDGLKLPTKRLAYVRGEHRHALNGRIVVSIDLSNIRLR
jgi:hypothetical protein